MAAAAPPRTLREGEVAAQIDTDLGLCGCVAVAAGDIGGFDDVDDVGITIPPGSDAADVVDVMMTQ